MSLNYKILWVDDEIDTIQEFDIHSEIKDYLQELGFIPHVDCFEDTSAAKNAIKSEKYDLILSDYNMDGGNGDELIKEIRDSKIFTEILFYSAQVSPGEKASKLYLDRISYFQLVDDRGYKKLKERIIWLIDQSIYKLQEIESLRGLVMSETSLLDSKVEEILLSYLENENEKTKKLRTEIIKKIKKSAIDNQKHSEKLDEKTNIEIVKERLFDADKKARAIKNLLEIEKHEIGIVDFYSSYKQDVLDVRNDLAHAKVEFKNGIEYLIITRKTEEIPTEFDSGKCIELRKNLLKYNSILIELKEKIKK